ncbi:hypothetical protein [Mycolicibacterium vaccae]|uniref:hypothetical protein n=1 Tax=Mycolicibacterium vaccae TaxID=1810 RepID=UPI003D040A11
MTWEDRMADRAREREQKCLDAERAAINALLPADDSWLNGWPRHRDSYVVMGTEMHCVGCGRLRGVICAVLPTDYDPPPTPRWPYTETDCPIPGCRDWAPTSTSFDGLIRTEKQ